MAPPPWVKPTGAREYQPGHYNIGSPTPRGELIGLYGAGGCGKTKLAALSERVLGSTVFIDLDDSLGVLYPKLQECGLSPQRVSGIKKWSDMIGLLDSRALDPFKTVVIDTASEAENMAMDHVVETIQCENGQSATSIESYGYGKGYRFLHDTFRELISSMREHAQLGRNMIIVMHDTTATVPNAEGADYLRHEPKLYADKSVSLRTLMQNSLDHLLYVGYDVEAKKGAREKHGKASGSGTRTIYPVETATCIAKSRRLDDPIPYIDGDDALWRALFPSNTTEPQGV